MPSTAPHVEFLFARDDELTLKKTRFRRADGNPHEWHKAEKQWRHKPLRALTVLFLQSSLENGFILTDDFGISLADCLKNRPLWLLDFLGIQKSDPLVGNLFKSDRGKAPHVVLKEQVDVTVYEGDESTVLAENDVRAIVTSIRETPLRQGSGTELQVLWQAQGLFSTFRSSNEYLEVFRQFARKAEKEIVGIGLGLSFLGGHYPEICEIIRNRVKKTKDLEIFILLADTENPALQTRWSEEMRAARDQYQADWPFSFPINTTKGLTVGLSESDRERVHVERLDFFPMMRLVKVDDWYLFSPYGGPQHSGWMSPCFVFKKPAPESVWIPFFDEIIDHARKTKSGSFSEARLNQLRKELMDA